MRERVACAFVFALLGTVLPTFAEPVRVTGGVLAGSDGSITDFSIFGPGFTLAGSADPWATECWT